MTRFPTSGVLLLLLILLATPVSAQVIMGGSPLGIPGSGTVTSVATTSPITGGTITSSGTIACATCTTSAGMTTGLFPVASGAHALVDSVFGQNTSAIVKTGSTAAVGGIGFNNAGNVEVIADGSTVVNAGMFAGKKSDFTIHDSTNENNNQFLMYNDSEGLASGVVTSIYGVAPANTWQLAFGDGAGGIASGLTQFAVNVGSVIIGPSVIGFSATNFQFSAPGSALITSPSGSYVYFDISGVPTTPNGNSNTFQVTDGTSNIALIVQHDGTSSISQIGSTNNASTATAGIKTEIIGNAASSTKAAATLEVQDAQSDVSLNLLSPTNNSIVTNVGTLSLNGTSVTAGSAPYMYFAVPGGATGFAIHAPDAMTGGVTKKFVWPADLPAADGQPLVANHTTGAFSFAAGLTENFALCTGAACATTCTLTVVGGIITGKSGTCP